MSNMHTQTGKTASSQTQKCGISDGWWEVKLGDISDVVGGGEKNI